MCHVISYIYIYIYTFFSYASDHCIIDMSVAMPICFFLSRMIRLNQAVDQTSEAAKALVCPLQRDVEQLKRDVSEIREILKQPTRHVLREVNEIQQASHTYTGAFIVSYNNKCFTYAAMFCRYSSKATTIMH